MIEFDCSQCHHHITAPDRDAGKEDICPKCNSPVIIPQAPAAVDSLAMPPRVPCPICGELIVATAKKCRFCGEVLGAASVPAPRGGDSDAAPHCHPTGAPRRSNSGRGKAEREKGIWDYLCDFWWYKYHDFDGRATRREFWLDQLHQFLSFIVLSPAYPVWFLVTLVPTLALVWRRSHDKGKSGGFGLLVSLIPCMVLLFILVVIEPRDILYMIIIGPLLWRWFGVNLLGFVRGTDGPNEYGPDPYDAG